MESTATRLKIIMEEKHLRQIDVVRMAEPLCKEYNLRLSKSDMSQFLSGKVEPGQWKLTLLGMVLDVSETWLMGYDVPRDREPTPSQPEPTAEERDDIKHLFQALTDENQKKLLDYARLLLVAQQADHGSQG